MSVRNLYVGDSNGRAVGVFDGLASRALLTDTVGWTGKNKNSLPYYEMSKTYNGIKYDVLDGGTVIANRTGSAQDSNLVLHYREKSYAYPLILPNGHYFVTGCPAGGSESTYFIEANITKNGARQILGYDTGNGLEIDLTGDDYSNTETCLGLVINVKSATATVSNLTFTPMVSDTGLPYEPYHDSVKETLREAEVIEGKNLFEPNINAIGVINNGITVKEITEDGKYVFDGAASVNTAIQIYIGNSTTILNKSPKIVLGKEYVLSGCPAGGSENTYYLYVTWRNADNTAWEGSARDYGNGVKFTIPTGRFWGMFFWFKSGQSAVGKTFSPMICTPEEWNKSSEYEPYHDALKDEKLSIKDQEILGALNLLENKGTTSVISGVTWTVNDDKTVMANHNPTGHSDFVIQGTAASSSGSVPLPANIIPRKSYYASIDKDTLSSMKGQMIIYFWDSNLQNQVNVSVNFGEEVFFTVPANAARWMVELYFSSSWTVLANTVFKPQISLKPNVPYSKYAMTNKELTDTNALDDSEFTPAANISIIGNWSAKWGKLIQVALLFKTSAAINANTEIFTMPKYKLANGKTNGTVMGCPLIMQNGAVNTIIQCDMPSADGAVKFRNLVTLTSGGDYKLSMLFICK